MARNITVSCVGPERLRADPDTPIDSAKRLVRAHLQAALGQVFPEKPDLIVLPEASDRMDWFGIEKRKQYVRAVGEDNLEWMRSLARGGRCYIAYGTIREMPDSSWRNSLVVIDRQGNIAGTYDKNHVVIEETAEAGILCGTEAPLIRCDFGTVACAICFDLQFDRLRLHYKTLAPDLILFSSRYHGGLAQALWAFTCRSWFAGAVMGLPCSILSPLGETVSASTMNLFHATARINLDSALVHLDHNLERFAAAKQKYGPLFTIREPPDGYLDIALLSSESPDRTIGEIMREFEIEPLESYLARSLAHHDDPAHRAAGTAGTIP